MRRRPGGRSAAVGHQVAEEVLGLLRDGQIDFGVLEVAERAGVHRSTVYRRWPTRGALVREALALHNSRIDVPDAGDYRTDVDLLARELASFFADPVEIALNALVLQRGDPELVDLVIEFWLPVTDQLAAVVGRAIDRGEIDPITRRSILTDLLVPAVLLPTQYPGAALSTVQLKALVDSVVLASRPIAPEDGGSH